MKIYIVEDDEVIAEALKQLVEKRGYTAYIAENFQDINAEYHIIDPQLILMDVNLPSQNGFYWTSQIRLTSKVPIIFVSSVTEKMDQLMAIQMGADDYITKPLDMELTLAKIQALLRRSYDFGSDAESNTSLNYQDATLSLGKAELTFGGEKVSLTFTELQLLTLLFKKQGEYASREELLDYSWQNDQFIDDNTLAVNMTRLRKKLRKIGLVDFIHTKKNVGYALKDGRAPHV